MMIDFLVIGHVVQDVVPNGYTLGGTTTFSSITARNLGRRPGIVTRLAPNFVAPPELHDIAIECGPSAQTTTFHNIYRDGQRQQFLLSVAEPIQPDDLPPAWRAAPIVHLGPLARELDARFARLFPRALVGVTPQGWLRQWDTSGKVTVRVWEEARDILPHVAALIVSEEDLGGDTARMNEYAQLTRVAVMTRGAQGCTVFTAGEKTEVAGFPANEVDPTGAGDVFAAAFLIRLHETHDPIQAARFANATASFCVQAPGVTGIPTRAQVEERMSHSQIVE
ncbi:MAG: ribokinase [Chloroflexi bacterium]|nr:ribokinase [Chloroflexota bacterium]